MGFSTTAAASAQTPEGVLAKFAAAWSKIQTYTCTITVREVLGSRVQDRVYHLSFSKPHDTRMDITDGDGAGGSALWHGGDTLYGHQGGFLRFIKLHENIHSRRAASLRGTTIADANFGALHDYVSGIRTTSRTVVIADGKTRITFIIASPAEVGNITRECLLLGADNLPAEFWQYEGDREVKHVVYSEVRLNVDLPPSTWNI